MTKSKRQSVLGFLWHDGAEFESFVFEGALDTRIVALFRGVSAEAGGEKGKKTVMVWDNAPTPRSAEFEGRRNGRRELE